MATPIRNLRVSDQDWKAWKEAAEVEGVSVTALVRQRMTEAPAERDVLQPDGVISPPNSLGIRTESTMGKRPTEPAGPVECKHPRGARTLLNGGMVRCGACGDLVK